MYRVLTVLRAGQIHGTRLLCSTALLVAALPGLATATAADDPYEPVEGYGRLPARIALGTVLWHDQVGDPVTAYQVAQVMRTRRATAATPNLDLAQASAAYQMGWVATGDGLLASLDEDGLSREQRTSLFLLRARHALETNNLPALERALTELDTRRDRRLPQVAFLAAELERRRGDAGKADRHARRIDKDHVLRTYAELNLGLDLLESDVAAARRLLRRVLDRPMGSWLEGAEARSLRDRARLGLALVMRAEGDQQAAQKYLLAISPGELMPDAIQLLADGAAAAGQWQEAARLWRYLMESSAGDARVSGAWLAYAESIERSAPRDVAWSAYAFSAAELEAERGQLATLHAGNPLTDTAVRTGVWRGWLSQAENFRGVQAFSSLRHARERLETRVEDLAALRAVAEEQGRRAELAGTRITRLGEGRLAELEARRTGIEGSIEAAFASSNVLFFADQEERRLMADIADLATRFDAIGGAATAAAAPRIERLRGVVRYRVAADLAARAEVRRARLRAMTETADASAARTQLVLGVAAAQGNSGFVADFERLSAQPDQLLVRARAGEARAQQAVLAKWQGFVARRLAVVDEELAALRLGMARVGDEQLMIAAGHELAPRSYIQTEETVSHARSGILGRMTRWLTPWKRN